MNQDQREQTEQVADEAEPRKRPWVTPSATTEKVTDITKNNPGGGADAVLCHS